MFRADFGCTANLSTPIQLMKMRRKAVVFLIAGVLAAGIYGVLTFTRESSRMRSAQTPGDSQWTLLTDDPKTWITQIRPAARPIASAMDATERAVALANESAWARYQAKPFTATRGTAVFENDRWIWRQSVGFRRGDLEAEIRLGADGAVEAVNVNLLIIEPESLSNP
jgi:hypothetical protein